MMIISLANQKGGVGKSTTTQNLNAGLQLEGYKTLVIDLDPQGNLSYAMNVEAPNKTAYDLLNGDNDCITHTEQGDLIASDKRLASIELDKEGLAYHLKNVLEGIISAYDIVLIDNAPTLSKLTTNALTASHGVIIPVEASIYSLQGLGQLNETITAVKQYTNSDLQTLGIVITRFNSRIVLNQTIADMLERASSALDTKVYETRIREAVAIREAQAFQQDIFSYDLNAKVASDYKALTKEVIEGMKEYE